MQVPIKELLKENSYFSNNSCLSEEIEKIIALEEEKREALLVYSKTKFDSGFLFEKELLKKEGKKIFIDFGELSHMSSFPGYYIVREIYDKLDEFNIPHKGEFPDTPRSGYQLDVESRYDNLLGVLKTDLYSLKLDEPLYILINNADLPFDNDFSLTFYNHFVFDKRTLPDNLHVFIITNSNLQIEENKEFLEVCEIEDSKDNPKLFFKELLEKYGKNISDEVLLLASPTLKLIDYLYILRYVLNYCKDDEFNKSINYLLNRYNTDEVLLNIFDNFNNRLSKYGRVVFSEALIDLYMFNFGLTENQILNSSRYLFEKKEFDLLSNYNEISNEEKELIISYLEFFSVKEEDRLIIKDQSIKEFIGTNAMVFTNIVTNNYSDRLNVALEHMYPDSQIFREYGFNALKAVYLEKYRKEEYFSKKNIVRHAIFEPLCKRLYNYIKDYYSKIKNRDDFDRINISDSEAFMISYIERSSIIYQSAIYYGGFDNVFVSKELVYMIISKSRRLLRRIITRYIATCFDYQTKVLNAKANDGFGVFVPLAGCFAYLFTEHGVSEKYRKDLTILVREVMKENDILTNGDFTTYYSDVIYSPITDFALVNGNSAIIDKINNLEKAIANDKDADFDSLFRDLKIYSSNYQNDENVFHKMLYAYLAFKTFIFLGEHRLVNKEASLYLNPIVEDILIYMEYCYYPEVYGSIYMYFGRLYPLQYLHRMEKGIHLMKSQGYLREINQYINAFKYFSSMKSKGDK